MLNLNLTFAVYVKLKLSTKRFSRKLGHNLCPKTVPRATSKQPIQLVLNFSTNVTALWSQNRKGLHLWHLMFRLKVMVNLSILTEFVEWQKNKHFTTLPLVSSRNDVCWTSAKIPLITMTCHYSDLGSVCFNQSEAALPSVRNAISALVPQKSFCAQYSRGVAKCPPFSKWLNLPPGKRQTKNTKLYLFQNITAAITATSNKTAITGPTTAPTGVGDPLTGSVADWDGTMTT